jgi:hypothetical protein
VTGRWVKKPRWAVSHLLRDDTDRPRHFGVEEGRAACGSAITIDRHLEDKPTGIDTGERCSRCEQAQEMDDRKVESNGR